MIQEQPGDKEMEKDRRIGGKGKEVLGVRLGAKDRSYLVRDKQIEVLKNVFGGVEVSVHNRPAYVISSVRLCVPYIDLLSLSPHTMTPQHSFTMVNHVHLIWLSDYTCCLLA